VTRATPLPPDQRRAALIAATEPLLETHGREVSTRQIAAAAGVAEGTIFRVFPTKEALIDAVIAEAFDVGMTCDAIAQINPHLDLQRRLTEVVDIIQRRLRRVFTLFHSVALPRPLEEDREAFHARLRRDNALLDGAIATVLEQDHQLLRLHPKRAASLLRAVTFSATHPLLCDAQQSDPDELVQFLLFGISRPVDTDSEDPRC
jgi:AcrR family transcriptional regulator